MKKEGVIICYLAHITLHNGERKEQTIKQHAINVANHAKNSLKYCGLPYMGYLAGVLHDMGKYSDKFQNYLELAFQGAKVVRGSVNHTFAGVIYLLEKYHTGIKRGYNTLTCEILAYAIGAHHGEFDLLTLDSLSGFEHRLQTDRNELQYEEVKKRFLEECISENELEYLFEQATKEIEIFYEKLRNQIKNDKYPQKESDFLLGMLTRMVLSAVINADRIDTAYFMNQIKSQNSKESSIVWDTQLAFMEKKLSQFKQDSMINQVRGEISQQCLNAANLGEGIYKISVPTGAGKTLAMLRYALAHAQKTHKNRIIFIIPLLSVLDQNSAVIHEYIADENLILEHHSNVVQLKEDGELDTYEFLAETWDSPIIISTLYQLLMSLFSDKTSCIRRMQALSNSIIVLDEAQSVPFKLTYQFNLAVNFLSVFCNTTVVFSSATQPCFEEVQIPLKFSKCPNLVQLTSEMRQAFKRTCIENRITPEGMTIEELSEFNLSLLDKVSSVLTICNTKKTAKEIYERIKLTNTDEDVKIFHLSTSMCMRHRVDVIREIKECLAAKHKMICVATQLVEAGIDFSFECVIRICAGMDNVAQAAGRCNRSFDYGYICKVYLVKLKEENLCNLKEVQLAQLCTQNLIVAYEENPELFEHDLLSNKSLEYYYRNLYKMLERENKLWYPAKSSQGEEYLFDLLSSNRKYVNRNEYKGIYVLNQAFKTAGSLFSVFDTDTTDIIVPYNREADRLIAELFSEKAKWDMAYTKECIKQLKPYTIQVWQYQKEKLYQDGMVYSDESGHVLFLQPQYYSKETGLDIENYVF